MFGIGKYSYDFLLPQWLESCGKCEKITFDGVDYVKWG